MRTSRLTMAQALVRYLVNQYVEIDGREERFFAGVWAIFGHGNVAAVGEALHRVRDELPTLRAHNEQAMAHSAIAFAKAGKRRRAMVCTSSIGPGATNMVTAAALAHVNRLPVLFLPGDVFSNRRPDPVLQQVESFQDGTVSANDCFRPVSRYFDRISRPEQLIVALPRMMATLTDPAECGPVTLAICQDVQAEAYDYPEQLFERTVWRFRRQQPDRRDVDGLAEAIKQADSPLIVAGGGVLYSGASQVLDELSAKTGIPVAETQAGKGALPWTHSCNLGGIGVTGTEAANGAAAQSDLIIGVGTRFQDFTTGSRSLFGRAGRRIFQINVASYDAHKHGAIPVVGDARETLEKLIELLDDHRVADAWKGTNTASLEAWRHVEETATADDGRELPTDAQVIGAVQAEVTDTTTIVGAAGSVPGEAHKLWRADGPDSYHMEYGYSCMGYEIAGGIGVKMAKPERDVVVLLGDGSYLMMNSELATSAMLGQKIIVVVLNNRGFGCINRLQNSTGNQSFNNLLKDAKYSELPDIDFAANARSLGVASEKLTQLSDMKSAIARARASKKSYVIVVDTDPLPSTEAGGCWWDVAVPEVSERDEVSAVRRNYEAAKPSQVVDG